ncbi:hypothetical protein APSETT445_008067 [Aspergillus pseudonomiae]
MKSLGNILSWDAIGENVMNGLHMERLLDLGVGSQVKVEEYERWDGAKKQYEGWAEQWQLAIILMELKDKPYQHRLSPLCLQWS